MMVLYFRIIWSFKFSKLSVVVRVAIKQKELNPYNKKPSIFGASGEILKKDFNRATAQIDVVEDTVSTMAKGITTLIEKKSTAKFGNSAS